MAHRDHQPGVYAKGEKTRYAGSAAEAVAAVFDGYKLVEASSDVPAEGTVDNHDEDSTDYRDLQAQAKELGIPANQSAEALRAAIDDANDQS